MINDRLSPDHFSAELDKVKPPGAKRHAAVIALVYLVFGIGYILSSGELVAAIAHSVADLQQLEWMKGIAFVVVTAVALYLICWRMLLRIERQYERIAQQLSAAHNSDRALLAGMFASTIAHDINNALTAGQMALGSLETNAAKAGTDPEDLAILRRALDDITAWNQGHFDLGLRNTNGPPQRFDLDELLASCVRLAQRHRRLRECHIGLARQSGPVDCVGHQHLVRRAVLNLILNTAEAGGANSRIELSLHDHVDGLSIVVEDDGPGVPPELRERILEPFFTTKSDGSGVGLTSVMGCAEAHGGSVTIGDSALGGARFQLKLARAG